MSFTDRIMVVVEASTGGAVREMDRLGRSTKDADKGAAALGRTLKQGLVAGAGAIVGAGLVAGIASAVEQYGNAAKAAGELAKATGGSVQNVSRFTAALADSGVTAEESAGLLRKFTTNAGKNRDELQRLGVAFKRGADGTIDYADAAVQAIDKINRIGDASTRNRLLVENFGKKGAAAFEELRASGVDLAKAMEAVSRYRVFDNDDVARAVAYDDAVDRLGASMQGLAFATGEKLIPALSTGADLLAGFVEAASSIPTEVYLAAGAFAALRVGAAKLGPALSSAVSEGALALTGLGAAADNAGGKVGLVKKGFGGIVSAIGPWNIALAAAAAAFTAVSIGADNARNRMQLFVAGLDGTQATLNANAGALLETSSAWERFVVTLTNSDQSLNPGTFTRIFIEAVGAAFGVGQDAADSYAIALQKVADEQGAAAAAAVDMSVQQRDLNDAITAFLQNDPSVTLQDIATAAQEAASSQGLVKEATRLAAEQIALASGDLGFFLAKLRELETFNGSGMETLKQQLIGISLVDDPDTTWVNEYIVGAEQAGDAILTNVIKAFETDPNFDPAKFFASLRAGAPPEMQSIIDSVEAQINADGGIKAIIDAKKAAADAKNDLLPLKEDIETPLKVNPDGSIETTKTGLTALGQPISTTLTVNAAFAPGGYEAVKARADYLSQERQGKIDVAHSFAPDGYNALKARSDYLSQNRNGSIGINVTFAPDGYNALKARKDYLAQDRTATIRVNTVGLETARAAIAGAQQNSARAANLSVSPQFSPINMVRVAVDGRELRSVIDDEIRALTPYRQEVA
jgi:hypothetical protein